MINDVKTSFPEFLQKFAFPTKYTQLNALNLIAHLEITLIECRVKPLY